MVLVSCLLLALLLDLLFQEPARYHPLVGFGNLASWLEKQLNTGAANGRIKGRISGLVAWGLIVGPPTLFFFWLEALIAESEALQLLVGGLMLYLAIGWQSLLSHGLAIAKPLAAGRMVDARQAVSMIVSRDTRELDEQAIAGAATESMLENGSDAIFSAIFWFCLLGIPGVVLYRLSNTLDAMWGYKNERFLQFGWAAARIDDLLNFIPARLTALSYALMGQTRISLAAWRQQAGNWKSPNAGPVMAAGAGAINVSLGGAAIYHGQLQERPPLGPQDGPTASAKSIREACALVNRVLLLWVGVIIVGVSVTALTAVSATGVSL
ncbi:adenosylcobinamide-phosphate synthase CbiB [Amphritea balenae]|uniref:Cobalamin biosynthesis protein CobD n=1 Tax=Amphritea balenae TaxID=452629 RepID=A0A3P1SX89_9GAMM|nr:adenosylcobinamide-phosphate synthase CbiB [Amphritea balenae]RRD00733.1 cobalamin biosynthesis protein [Amphritea balenae]GGK68227.1 cobalamin biosynthesis protein CobD [Amphritea balenae]